MRVFMCEWMCNTQIKIQQQSEEKKTGKGKREEKEVFIDNDKRKTPFV